MENNADIMLMAARALTFMADVLPTSCGAIVRHGAVPALCARLLTIEYIDLAEQSLQVRYALWEQRFLVAGLEWLVCLTLRPAVPYGSKGSLWLAWSGCMLDSAACCALWEQRFLVAGLEWLVCLTLRPAVPSETGPGEAVARALPLPAAERRPVGGECAA